MTPKLGGTKVEIKMRNKNQDIGFSPTPSYDAFGRHSSKSREEKEI